LLREFYRDDGNDTDDDWEDNSDNVLVDTLDNVESRLYSTII
jgi:hypothetical protein